MLVWLDSIDVFAPPPDPSHALKNPAGHPQAASWPLPDDSTEMQDASSDVEPVTQRAEDTPAGAPD